MISKNSKIEWQAIYLVRPNFPLPAWCTLSSRLKGSASMEMVSGGLICWKVVLVVCYFFLAEHVLEQNQADWLVEVMVLGFYAILIQVPFVSRFGLWIESINHYWLFVYSQVTLNHNGIPYLSCWGLFNINEDRLFVIRSWLHDFFGSWDTFSF